MPLRHGLATALEAVGRKTEAAVQYRRAIALKPGVAQPVLDYAYMLIDEGQYNEAQRQLQSLVLGPSGESTSAGSRAMALYGLAVIAANRDSLSAALGLLEETLRLAPGYQAALSLRTQIQNDLRR
jgi:Flp pilus assembly protein TadD